jgi:hypothetical protein
MSGSEDGTASSKSEPRATTSRCCPHCNSASVIRPLGRVEIVNGMVRSLYCCATCDRAFVFVRRALG